jgi:hypothetical protein
MPRFVALAIKEEFNLDRRATWKFKFKQIKGLVDPTVKSRVTGR